MYPQFHAHFAQVMYFFLCSQVAFYINISKMNITSSKPMARNRHTIYLSRLTDSNQIFLENMKVRNRSNFTLLLLTTPTQSLISVTRMMLQNRGTALTSSKCNNNKYNKSERNQSTQMFGRLRKITKSLPTCCDRQLGHLSLF